LGKDRKGDGVGHWTKKERPGVVPETAEQERRREQRLLKMQDRGIFGRVMERMGGGKKDRSDMQRWSSTLRRDPYQDKTDPGVILIDCREETGQKS